MFCVNCVPGNGHATDIPRSGGNQGSVHKRILPLLSWYRPYAMFLKFLIIKTLNT